MEAPLKYIAEIILKKYLQNYFKKEDLLLDSFSLFGTNAVIKNLILKPKVIQHNIRLLSGEINELSIEGSVFEKKINVNIDGLTLNVFVPGTFINQILSSNKKKVVITEEMLNSYNYEKNQLNGLFTVLDDISPVTFSILNVKIHIYGIIADTLLHFIVAFAELISSVQQTNEEGDNNPLSISLSRALKLSKLTITVDFFRTPENLNVGESEGGTDLTKYFNKNITNDQIFIKESSFFFLLTARKVRFERAYPECTTSNGIDIYKHFDEFEHNSELIIEILELELLVNDKMINNFLRLFNIIHNRQRHRAELFRKGRDHIWASVHKLKQNTNDGKSRGFPFHKPTEGKFLQNYRMMEYLTYIMLIMRQRKWLSFSMNFYVCEKLVMDYQADFKDDHDLLDYLINENIGKFLESPAIAGVKSKFLNMDFFNKLKRRSQNRTIIEFLFFIMKKFLYYKRFIHDFMSYDDFMVIKAKICKLKLHVTRQSIIKSGIPTNSTEHRNTVSSIHRRGEDSNTPKILSSCDHTLEKIVCDLRNAFLDDFSEETNTLLTLDLSSVELTAFTNWNEYFFLRGCLHSLKLWDVSYRAISEDKYGNGYMPLLRIEHDTTLGIYCIKKCVCEIQIDVPTVFAVIDPYGLYFCKLFYIKIETQLMEMLNSNNTHQQGSPQMESKKVTFLGEEEIIIRSNLFEQHSTEKKEGNDVEKERTGTAIANTNSPLKSSSSISFPPINIQINRIIINANHTKLTNIQDESLIFQFSLLKFDTAQSNITLTIEELVLGSIQNLRLQQFIQYENYLALETNIFNLFDLKYTLDSNSLFKEKNVIFPFNVIYVQLTKRDVSNFQKFLSEISTIMKLIPANNENKKIEMTTVKGDVKKKARASVNDQSFFISIPIEKIVISLILGAEKEKIKNLICVIDNFTFVHMQMPNEISTILTLSTCKMLEKHIIEKKMIEWQASCEITKEMIRNGAAFEDLKSRLINQVDPSQRVVFHDAEKKYDSFVILKEVDCKYEVLSSLPKIICCFDHNIVRGIITFIEFKNERINELSDKVMSLLRDLHKTNPKVFKYFVNTDKKFEESIPKKIKQIRVNISAFQVDFMYSRKPFLKLDVETINIELDEDILRAKLDILSLTDERYETSLKKKIIYKIPVTKANSLKFTLIMNMKDNKLDLIFENPRIIFLLRVILDIIEYFYFIIIKEVFSREDFAKIYNLENSLEKRLPKLESIIYSHPYQAMSRESFRNMRVSLQYPKLSATPTRGMKKKAIDTLHHHPFKEHLTTIHSDANSLTDIPNDDKIAFDKIKALQRKSLKEPDILINTLNNNSTMKKSCLKQDDDETLSQTQAQSSSPLKVKIIVLNGEVGICMNSIKQEELILSVSEIEFANYFDNEETKRYLLNKIDTKVEQLEVDDMKNKDKDYFMFKDAELYVRGNNLKIFQLLEGTTISNEVVLFSKGGGVESASNKNIHHGGNMGINEQFIGNFLLLIEILKYDEVLTNVKLVLMIPFLKIRLYTDIYEQILRFCFENIYEMQTVTSECSEYSKVYFRNQKHEYPIQYKHKTIFAELMLFCDECYVNIYNFPSLCLLHKQDNKNKFHKNMKCKFYEQSPHLELDKMCTVILNSFYLMLRFFNSGQKNIVIKTDSLDCELNSYLKAFSQYSSYDMITIKGKRRMKKEIERQARPTIFQGGIHKVISASSSKMMHTSSSKSLLGEAGLGVGEKFSCLSLSIEKTAPSSQDCLSSLNFDIVMQNFQIKFLPLPIIALYRFFIKYFFYYQNRKVKYIHHDEVPSKTIKLSLINTEVYLQSNYTNHSNVVYYEILTECNFTLYMNILGNSTLGPFKSIFKYEIDINSIYLNDIDKNDCQKYSGKNQILDNVKLCIDIFSESHYPMEETGRYYYMFCRYSNNGSNFYRITEKNNNEELHFNTSPGTGVEGKDPENVSVQKDLPSHFRDYIRTYKFKEEEVIRAKVDYLSKTSDKPIEVAQEKEKERDVSSASGFGDIELAQKMLDTGTIRISLTVERLLHLKKIFDDITRHISENHRYVLHSLNVKTSFDEIAYDSTYALYLSEIEVTLCDSQFNAQLFQIIVDKLMLYVSNKPDDNFLSTGLARLMKKFFFGEEDEKKYEELQLSRQETFNTDILSKFLIKVNYHNNSNRTNPKSKLQKDGNKISARNEMEIPLQGNQNIVKSKADQYVWEPFIEPLPAKFTYIQSNVGQYVKMDLLSLKQTYDGIRNICRQRKFHSLNININERLMESVNDLIKDYQNIKKTNDENPQEKVKEKQLIVLNLTEYQIIIDQSENFEEYPEIKEKERERKKRSEQNRNGLISMDDLESPVEVNNANVFKFKYKTVKKINDRDELYVYFNNNPRRGESLAYSKSIKINSESDRLKKTAAILSNDEAGSNSMSNTNNEQTFKQKMKTTGMNINIEKPSKFFSILRNRTVQGEKNDDDNKEELKRNFDNKASMLLKGEHFLVCEIGINSDENKKLVTFRSNEGIKNELDFPVRIKFILKEKTALTNFYDLKIMLEPGHYFFIPPLLLDTIKEIQFKPILHTDMLKFRGNVYPYDKTFIRQEVHDSQYSIYESFYKISCPIKEIRVNSYVQGKRDGKKEYDKPFMDSIVFGVVKKFDSVENECLEQYIKLKMEYIKSYSRYNLAKEKERKNEEKSQEFDTRKILSDITYVLTPIMRLYNSLPRDIRITKKLPKDYNCSKVKGACEKIPDYFDVEHFFKKHAEQEYPEVFMALRGENKQYCRQEYYRDLLNCDYEMKKNEIKSRKYIHKTKGHIKIRANGDWLSIYEPFIVHEKGSLHFQYTIKVRDDTQNEGGASFDSNHIGINVTPHYEYEFEIKPFCFATLNKLNKIKDDDNIKNMLSFDKNAKDKARRLKSVSQHNKNILFLTYDITENHVLNAYLYCPYLFLNCSDFDLKLRYKEFIQKLPKKLSNKVVNLNSEKGGRLEHNEVKEKSVSSFTSYYPMTELDCIVMFNPENKKYFLFQLGREEKIIKEGKDISSIEWKEIQVLDSSKTNGISVDLTGKKVTKQIENIFLKKANSSRGPGISYVGDEGFNLAPDTSHKKQDGGSVQVDSEDKKIELSLQMKSLSDSLKWSTLIIITPSIYIYNKTNKDIYIYHFPNIDNQSIGDSFSPTLSIKREVVKENSTMKFHHLINYYQYVKLSFEEKFSNNPMNFSGMIKFSLNDEKSKEFSIAIGDPGKEPLLVVKIYEEQGFLCVVIRQKESIEDYPYIIVNKLSSSIKFKQKESEEDEINQMMKNLSLKKKIDYKHLDGVDLGISKVQTIIKTETNSYSNSNNLQGAGAIDSKSNKAFYTWEEPLMYDKEKNCNILEIFLFGSKFEIDPQEIQREITFSSRVEMGKKYDVYLNDSFLLKGKIRIKDRKREYVYLLYKYALVLRNEENEVEAEPIVFEFHDKNLICERKYDGNFSMKISKEYEMFCVSLDETNALAEKIFFYIGKAREFTNSIVIKKYVKNRCIFVEITQKSEKKEKCAEKIKTTYFFNIENVSISFIQKNAEFMYFWLKNLALLIEKDTGSDGNESYKKIILKIKDYQIDQYSDSCHYPVVLSPLSDKSYNKAFKDFDNFLLVMEKLQFSSEFYQVESLYASIAPMDMRFEFKFIDKLSKFISLVTNTFYSKDNVNVISISDVINEIDTNNNLVDENKIASYDTRLHIKQFVIDDIQICVSMKFENIDVFLEKSSFLFLKPLIEELGLKILNMDSSMFAFPNFIKTNIYQSSDDFVKIFKTFYFQQFVSELVKSLGGINSVTSIQLMENLNNRVLTSMRIQRNALKKYRSKNNRIQDLYKSGYQNVSIIVGGVFMLAYKMMAMVGKFFAYLTLDETFKQRRLNKINRSVKNFYKGIALAFKILFFALCYVLSQFYYVPKSYFKRYHYTIALLLTILIILIGIVIKPIVGVCDFCSKTLETIGVTINDILADRVKIFARFQRQIKENELREYNSTDALAYMAKKALDSELDMENTEDIKFAVPGELNKEKMLVLFTTDRMMIIQHRGDDRFVPRYVLHFSECELYQQETPNRSRKKLEFLKDPNGNRYVNIQLIEKKTCISRITNMVVHLHRLNEETLITKRYDMLIKGIIEKKNDNLENEKDTILHKH